MNNSETIDAIFTQMVKNSNRLSVILPQVYPIALECKDYIGFCILYHWGTPIGECKEANQTSLHEATTMLVSMGISEEKAREYQQEAFAAYITMRTVNAEKDQISIWSVREMEDYFKRCDELIAALEVPKELAPVDLYYRSEASSSGKIKILERRQEVEKQYAILHGFLTTKLANYKAYTLKKERKEEVEKSIKNSKNVFIIHGHCEAKRRELENLLGDKFNLVPIVLSEKPNQGLTIIEKFEKYAEQCSYAFALFTPDDIISSPDGHQYFQARPNVIFELGWFYANLGRSRVCILDQESEKSSIFSDLQGVMRVQFKDNISEKIMEIERELKSVGIIG